MFESDIHTYLLNPVICPDSFINCKPRRLIDAGVAELVKGAGLKIRSRWVREFESHPLHHYVRDHPPSTGNMKPVM